MTFDGHRQVVILHGWSDEAQSFKPLARYLLNKGFTVVPVWLGEYRSMVDWVHIEDVARRMEEVIRDKMDSGELENDFDLIVHSTGGLVAREWISRFYLGGGCPAQHLIMLAPANFGSRLAHSGRSLPGRLIKGREHWFRTGQCMLDALELASQYQEDLAFRDLFVPPGQTADTAPSPYGPGKVLPMVITGTIGDLYLGEVVKALKEPGADGVVRASAANLNVNGATVRFTRQGIAQPQLWEKRHGAMRFPFLVLPGRDHDLVKRPDKKGRGKVEHRAGFRLVEAIDRALAVQGSTQRYEALADEWLEMNERVASLARTDGAQRLGLDQVAFREPFRQHIQLVVCARDDNGAALDDYYIALESHENESLDARKVQAKVLRHCHVNELARHRRSIYLDRFELMERYDRENQEFIDMSVVVEPHREKAVMALELLRNERYDWYYLTANEPISMHACGADLRDGIEYRLRRNETFFLHLEVPRIPAGQVFTLEPYK